MKTVQQWFVTVALASIGVVVVFIIVSAQVSSDNGSSDTDVLQAPSDQQEFILIATPIPSIELQATLPPAATIAPQGLEHSVASGETLGTIANLYCLTWQELAAYNQLSDPDNLKIGQVLKIPSEC